MVNVFAKLLYQIKKDRRLMLMLMSLISVIDLQLMNLLVLRLLGLINTAWPWSFIEVLRNGFIVTVLLAFSLVFLPIVASILWCVGGIKRSIANNLLLFWVAFITSSWLGLYMFTLWDGLTVSPYPWLSYSLLMRLPRGGEHFTHLVISLLVSYAVVVIGFVINYFSGKSQAAKVFGSAHFSTSLEIQRAGLFSNNGLLLGKAYGKPLRLPGYEGVLVVAPMGSGKTTAIAIPNLLDWKGSGVFNDLKGELYRLTANYRKTNLQNKCYLWSPADPEKKSACYNPFFYVSTNPELRIRDLQLIAETMIPATKLGDGFWHQSSREIFLTLSLYLFEKKGMATLSEIHDLSKQESFFAWLVDEVVEHEDRFSTHLLQNVYAILGADEKTQKNILKDFQSRMTLFADPIIAAATSNNDFDFRELRRQKISIYIHIPESDKERLSPILTLFWTQLINTMSSQEPDHTEPYGVLALMDEFGNMARITKLKDGISFLRSYHMRCVVIVQYLAQITAIYGRDEAKGFLNSKVKIAFALNDLEDAQFFSKALGTKTVRVTASSVSTGHGSHSGSRSKNTSYQARALLSADELMQLNRKKAVILLEGRSPVKADKGYWFKEPKYRQLLTKIGVQS